MSRRLDSAILLLERLRPTDWQRTLAWAAAIGVSGALATLGFREALVLLERLFYGTGVFFGLSACAIHIYEIARLAMGGEIHRPEIATEIHQ